MDHDCYSGLLRDAVHYAYTKGAVTVALASVAQGLTGSAEFKALYGAQASNSVLVTAMYMNVLQRASDAAGLTD